MNTPEKRSVLDEDIVHLKAFLKGDEDAFTELMRKHKTGVYRVAISILKDRRMAEEATEDTFVKLFKKAHTFQHRSSFKTWLYTIAVNTSRNYLKKLIREKERLSYNDSIYNVRSDNDPLKRMELKRTVKIMEGIIEKLPERQKEVFRMKYFAELTIREIAETLGISEGGVKASLSFALSKVREEMAPHLGEV